MQFTDPLFLISGMYVAANQLLFLRDPFHFSTVFFIRSASAQEDKGVGADLALLSLAWLYEETVTFV